MAVAFDAESPSHTGVEGAVATFSWTHTPAGTPKGALVFVMNRNATFPYTSVTYGGVAMTAVPGGDAVDTVGEACTTRAYFLGSGVPTGAQTVEVVKSAGTMLDCVAVCFTVTAATNTEVYGPGIVLLQEDIALAVQSVTDGSPGTDSLRFAAVASGASNPPPAGTGSTQGPGNDFGTAANGTVRETTAGQGARNVGFTLTIEDVAAVHLAVREVPVVSAIPALLLGGL